MKTYLALAFCLAFVVPLIAEEPAAMDTKSIAHQNGESFDDLMDAQPKLLRISATVDGSGKIVFTRQSVRYENKQWSPLTNVVFGGEPWPDLSRTPPAWLEMSGHLDLSKAWIVKRKGRDMIALEHTADGFDLYLCDSPNGSAEYEVTIAIPRR